MPNFNMGDLLRCTQQACRSKEPWVRRVEKLVVRKPNEQYPFMEAIRAKWTIYCCHCNNVIADDVDDIMNLPGHWGKP